MLNKRNGQLSGSKKERRGRLNWWNERIEEDKRYEELLILLIDKKNKSITFSEFLYIFFRLNDLQERLNTQRSYRNSISTGRPDSSIFGTLVTVYIQASCEKGIFFFANLSISLSEKK